MIVPMKKADIIVQEKDAQATVNELRSLGLLHVEHINPPQGEDINVLREDVSLANSCLDTFRRAGIEIKEAEVKTKADPQWKINATHIVDLGKRHERLLGYIHSLDVQINEWQRWGDFDPQEINLLRQRGIYVRLFEIPQKQVKELPKDAIVKNIFSAGGVSHCVVVSRAEFESELKEVRLPRYGLSEVRARLSETGKTVASIEDQMQKYAFFYGECLAAKKYLEQEIEFQQALCGMGKDAALAYISGYIPFDAVGALQAEAKEKSWGVVIREPEESDNVPTLLRNPRWIAIIRPVFKLLEINPGYRELDISPLFLCFLSLFFGMIISDAGYGVIYFTLTYLAQRKLGGKYKDKRVFFLFYLFSSCAILWGVLTGTVFGQEWYLKSGFKPVIPALSDTKILQAFCFFLGAFHLTLAHAWQAVRKAPSLTALADTGWICILWAAFFLAKTLILGDALPVFTNWLIIGGILLVIFFSRPQRNILKAIGQGLGVVALSLVNNFTDIVSYIRLFAVGLAGIAISDTVNTLAASFGKSNILVMAAIMFLGHTVNIILGPLSVMVHGIRLNVLEFSNHAGLTWSGIAYKPLKN